MKAVHVGHSSTLQQLILDEACWYLNESSLHEESEYVIVKLIQGSTYIGIWYWVG